jgi:hypothetical protein
MSGPDPGMAWRFQRAIARIEPAAERVLASLVVHDFNLFDPLPKAIPTRHVHLRFAGARDFLT